MYCSTPTASQRSLQIFQMRPLKLCVRTLVGTTSPNFTPLTLKRQPTRASRRLFLFEPSKATDSALLLLDETPLTRRRKPTWKRCNSCARTSGYRLPTKTSNLIPTSCLKMFLTSWLTPISDGQRLAAQCQSAWSLLKTSLCQSLQLMRNSMRAPRARWRYQPPWPLFVSFARS